MATPLPNWLLRFTMASLLGLCLAPCVLAAEPTVAEQQYEQLKAAEKHNDKRLAERWNKLVRQRQWVDSTGKHKTYARYVDHDPKGQWVKLLVLVSKGDQPSYKEGTIPLARLSKSDQAVVKRIGIVRKQVETALADASPGGSPLGEGNEVGEVAATAEMRGEVPPASAEAAAAAPPDMMRAMEPWRTDFAAFAANLSAARGEDGQWTLNWGELHGVKAVHEKERMLAMLKKIPADQRPPYAIRYQQGFTYGWARGGLGEVFWETTLTGPPNTDGSLQHDLKLAEPFSVVLLPEKAGAESFARLQPGERVRFVGRLAELGGFGETPALVLRVRPLAEPPPLSNESPTANLPANVPAPSADVAETR